MGRAWTGREEERAYDGELGPRGRGGKRERRSARGLCEIFGVAARWTKKRRRGEERSARGLYDIF
jgi:hypothetical protein